MTALQKIKFYFFKRALLRAIKKANKERSVTHYKMIVMKTFGWPHVYRWCDIKEKHRRKGFKKGVTLESIRNNALYITN
jgi:hypothetical protein